ncbi:hypothetical protein ACVWXN_006007 [Bradyrhizobium sp. i1.4.4]|uniref:hypothetical protein n=1 Tax=unclassified Bradyrhizobium TaxID=2631580 RepID=UPI003398E3B0
MTKYIVTVVEAMRATSLKRSLTLTTAKPSHLGNSDTDERSVHGAPPPGGAPFLMSGTALMLRGRGRPGWV